MECFYMHNNNSTESVPFTLMTSIDNPPHTHTTPPHTHSLCVGNACMQCAHGTGLHLTVYSLCTLHILSQMAHPSVGVWAIGVQHLNVQVAPELAGACQPRQAHWEHLSRHRLAHAASSAGPPILLTMSINHPPVRSSCCRDYAMCLPSFGGAVSLGRLQMFCVLVNATPAFL